MISSTLLENFLQVLCLKIMSDNTMFDHAAFLGGTSLRILFNLRRFSEDLGFSLIDQKTISMDETNTQFIRSFGLYGLEVETKVKSKGAVNSIHLKFKGLLKELGLSDLADQKLSIKWDIDTNPPKGAEITETIVNKTYIFGVRHYDLPSLYAGKLHACFFRSYTKGRDIYDLAWYLSRKTKPNFTFLNNAIEQTEGANKKINPSEFKDFLLSCIAKIDFEKIKKDVERFLEDPNELNLFDFNFFRGAVEGMEI